MELHRAAYNRASAVNPGLLVPPLGDLAEDERAEAFAKAIVSFDVDKLDDYAAEVILQFRAGMVLSLADLKKTASRFCLAWCWRRCWWTCLVLPALQ